MFESNVCKKIDLKDIKKIIFDFLGKDIIISEIKLLKGGLFNTTYFFKTKYPENKYIIRIAPENKDLLFNYEKNMMKIEKNICEIFDKNNIPTSKVLYENLNCNIINREYLILKYIDGFAMSEINLEENEKSYIYEKLGFYTRKIHNIKSKNFGWPSKNGEMKKYKYWYDFIVDYVDEIIEKVTSYNIFEKNYINDFTKIIYDNKDLFNGNIKPSLVHNDLWEPNIIINKNEKNIWEISAIIDSDRVFYGHNEFEYVLWNMNKSFKKGYQNSLDESLQGKKRKICYQLITATSNAFIIKMQHNNLEGYNYSVNWGNDLLKLFYSL